MNGLFLFCKYRCRLALKTQSSDTDQEDHDQSNTSYMKLQDKTCSLTMVRPWLSLPSYLQSGRDLDLKPAVLVNIHVKDRDLAVPELWA